MEQMVMAVPQVSVEETKRFSQVWNHNGVSVVLDDVTMKFATDFTNVCLRSAFMQLLQQMTQAAEAKLKETEQKKVILEG